MDVDDDQDPETWAALGGTRTLRQLAEHAITHSGNLATNLLLDVVGREEVAHVLRAGRVLSRPPWSGAASRTPRPARPASPTP